MTGDVLGMAAETDDELVTPISAVCVVRGLDERGNERDFIVRAGKVRSTDAIGMLVTALAMYLKAIVQ